MYLRPLPAGVIREHRMATIIADVGLICCLVIVYTVIAEKQL